MRSYREFLIAGLIVASTFSIRASARAGTVTSDDVERAARVGLLGTSLKNAASSGHSLNLVERPGYLDLVQIFECSDSSGGYSLAVYKDGSFALLCGPLSGGGHVSGFQEDSRDGKRIFKYKCYFGSGRTLEWDAELVVGERTGILVGVPRDVTEHRLKERGG